MRVLDPTNGSKPMPLSADEAAEWRRYIATGVPPGLRVTLKVEVWRLVDDVLAAVRAATLAELAKAATPKAHTQQAMNPRELWRLAVGPMLAPHTGAVPGDPTRRHLDGMGRPRQPGSPYCGPVVFERDLAELHERGAIAFRCRCGGTGLIVGNAWVAAHQVWDQPPLVTIRELVRARQEFDAMAAGAPAMPWWWQR